MGPRDHIKLALFAGNSKHLGNRIHGPQTEVTELYPKARWKGQGGWLATKEEDLKDSVHIPGALTTGERLQLLAVFSWDGPNISAKHLTSCIPLLECIADAFANAASYSVAPGTTMDSLSSICVTLFVWSLDPEPEHSLAGTQATPSSSNSQGKLYSKDARNSRLPRPEGDTALLHILFGAQIPRLSSKEKLNHSTNHMNFHFLWLGCPPNWQLPITHICTWKR